MLIAATGLILALATSVRAHPLTRHASLKRHAQSERGGSYTAPGVTGNSSIISSSAYTTLTSLLPTILSNAISCSSYSWELGTLTQSLLEVYYSELTPFAYNPSALGSSHYVPAEVLDIAALALTGYNWTGSPESSDSTLSDYLSNTTTRTPLIAQPLVDGDGALGDPCSLGTAAWLLANFAKSTVGDASADAYAWAVGNQYAYLLDGPMSSNGTISQREGYFEVWADMGYMIPAFPAFLGLTTSSSPLLQEAITQWLLEASSLFDPSVNLFRHINDWDARFWATGNGWMLTGLMRVLASIDAADQSDTFSDSIEQAETMAAAVFASLWGQLDSSSLLPDYMFQSNATLATGDAAGTAAVVAAFYRFLVLSPSKAQNLIPGAEVAFDGVVAMVSSSGWLTNVVDPLGTYGWVVYPNSTLESPEGQSFLGLMWAARTAAGQ